MAFLDLFCFLSHSACVCWVGWLVSLLPGALGLLWISSGPPALMSQSSFSFSFSLGM